MKKMIAGIGIFAVTAAVVVAHPLMNRDIPDIATTPIAAIHGEKDKPLIQMAILLDTSDSMRGLINQTRDQLWQVVNRFAQSNKDGVTPRLEVAVYEYGNDALSGEVGFIRKITDLTTELDAVSEALFALTTQGGSEYCGYVIQEAVTSLAWDKGSDSVKVIFIAGNEPFNQGPVAFQQAIALAKEKGITVNTLHAGESSVGEQSGWKTGAVLAGGDYISIDHNHVITHVNAPQDQKLAELNAQLNQTYIPYGKQGAEKAKRQAAMDNKNQGVSMGQFAKRIISKASGLYRNESWDLVDAVEDGKVDLSITDPNSLPVPMQSMDEQKRAAYVQEKAAQRKKIKQEIEQLSKAREQYVAEQEAKAPEPAASTMNEAMTAVIEKQSKKKGYRFDQKP